MDAELSQPIAQPAPDALHSGRRHLPCPDNSVGAGPRRPRQWDRLPCRVHQWERPLCPCPPMGTLAVIAPTNGSARRGVCWEGSAERKGRAAELRVQRCRTAIVSLGTRDTGHSQTPPGRRHLARAGLSRHLGQVAAARCGGGRCRPNLRHGAGGPPGTPGPVLGTALPGDGVRPQPEEPREGPTSLAGAPRQPRSEELREGAVGLSLSTGVDTG